MMDYDYDDYESLPHGSTVYAHMMAGAAAGIMEHGCMYPIDSVKTRMQSLVSYKLYEGKGLIQSLTHIVKTEGWKRPIRGLNIVMIGAGPAHAFYFSSYEALKKVFLIPSNHNQHTRKLTSNHQNPLPFVKNHADISIHSNKNGKNINNTITNPGPSHAQETLAHGAAGICATLVHDAIMNPVEVIKQRLQSYGSPYRGVQDCATGVYKHEGLRAFYRSYGTQLALNIPFQATHFITYELCRKFFYNLRHRNTNNNNKPSMQINSNSSTHPSRNYYYDPVAHLLSGAIAGGLAAAVTNPLDVCKTLLNTQEIATTDTNYPHVQNTLSSRPKAYSDKVMSPNGGKTSCNSSNRSNCCFKSVPSMSRTNLMISFPTNIKNHRNNSANFNRFNLGIQNGINASCITVLSTLSSIRPLHNSDCSSPPNPYSGKTSAKLKNFPYSFRTNCHQETLNHSKHIKGLLQAARTIYQVRGWRGFGQGLKARCVYQMPATAFSWSIYEFFKYFLSTKI